MAMAENRGGRYYSEQAVGPNHVDERLSDIIPSGAHSNGQCDNQLTRQAHEISSSHFPIDANCGPTRKLAG